MILTFFLIGAICLTSGIIYYARCGREEWIYYTLNVVGGILIAIISIVGLVMIGLISQERIIDDKIALYEEENTRIQTQVTNIVERYLEHEQETYDKVLPDSDPTFIVTLFPELKSNELVAKEIELYQSNAAKLKSLKVEKLEIKVYKWWLYFGG